MTSPYPYRPSNDEQPTAPYPMDTSYPSTRLFGQQAKVTQRPATVDEQPTMRLPHEFVTQMRAQREVWIAYHRREATRLRDEAEWIECAAPKNLVSHAHICTLHEEELGMMRGWDWKAMTENERDRERFLGSELLRLRTESAILRNSQMELWEQAARHEDAIRQIQAEMTAVGQ